MSVEVYYIMREQDGKRVVMQDPAGGPLTFHDMQYANAIVAGFRLDGVWAEAVPFDPSVEELQVPLEGSRDTAENGFDILGMSRDEKNGAPQGVRGPGLENDPRKVEGRMRRL